LTPIKRGIVAHVDAGKTCLTRENLYETHIIDDIGRVDKDTPRTEALALIKRKSTMIKASVVSFFVTTLKSNQIYTPLHTNFLVEVERSLTALAGATLLISTLAECQARPTILRATLSKLCSPTIISNNKSNYSNTHANVLIKRLEEKLTAQFMPLDGITQIETRSFQCTIFRH
jgi:ribosomal protection tetracycline resistance protein